MTATGGYRRGVRVIVVPIAVVPIAILALADCGRGDGPEPAPTLPTESATPSMDPIGLAQAFPATPQEYAEVTVGAWAAPDLIRLAELTTPEVHTEIIEIPGPPDLNWTFVACADHPDAGGPAADRSECSFYNLDGDYLVLTIEHELLGGERAATAMVFEAISYPDDEVAYVETFVTAWQAGNQARMRNLAVPAAFEAYAALPPPEPTTEVGYETGGSTDTEAEVLATITGAEAAEPTEVTFSVNTSLLGEAQAIRTASLDLE